MAMVSVEDLAPSPLLNRLGGLLGSLGVSVLYVVVWRLFLSPLARVPGPKLAALTSWYELYYDLVLGGQYEAKIAQLHEQYGPVVRINPHEVHIQNSFPSLVLEQPQSAAAGSQVLTARLPDRGGPSATLTEDADVDRERVRVWSERHEQDATPGSLVTNASLPCTYYSTLVTPSTPRAVPPHPSIANKSPGPHPASLSRTSARGSRIPHSAKRTSTRRPRPSAHATSSDAAALSAQAGNGAPVCRPRSGGKDGDRGRRPLGHEHDEPPLGSGLSRRARGVRAPPGFAHTRVSRPSRTCAARGATRARCGEDR